MKYYIMLVLLTNRVKEAIDVQKVLTEFGSLIKTRLGLHETENNVYSDRGLLILQLVGDEREHQKMKEKLGSIEGVKVNYIAMNG
ncbi:MAG: hypothetical protein ACP5QT_08710 [Brevinematia bacterium]